jgi:hypothetical protein
VSRAIKTVAHRNIWSNQDSSLSKDVSRLPGKSKWNWSAAYQKCLDLIDSEPQVIRSSKLSGWNKKQQITKIVRMEQKTADYRNCQDGTKDSMSSKLSGKRTGQQVIEIISIKQKTAGYWQSQDSYQVGSWSKMSRVIKTVAHQNVKSEYRTASHLESQEETQNTAAYRKCQNRRSQPFVKDTRTATHQRCQQVIEKVRTKHRAQQLIKMSGVITS